MRKGASLGSEIQRHRGEKQEADRHTKMGQELSWSQLETEPTAASRGPRQSPLHWGSGQQKCDSPSHRGWHPKPGCPLSYSVVRTPSVVCSQPSLPAPPRSTFRHPSLSKFPFQKDISHIWIRGHLNDLILTDYICNNPICKESHILRYRGVGFQYIKPGGRHNTAHNYARSRKAE